MPFPSEGSTALDSAENRIGALHRHNQELEEKADGVREGLLDAEKRRKVLEHMRNRTRVRAAAIATAAVQWGSEADCQSMWWPAQDLLRREYDTKAAYLRQRDVLEARLRKARTTLCDATQQAHDAELELAGVTRDAETARERRAKKLAGLEVCVPSLMAPLPSG